MEYWEFNYYEKLYCQFRLILESYAHATEYSAFVKESIEIKTKMVEEQLNLLIKIMFEKID